MGTTTYGWPVQRKIQRAAVCHALCVPTVDRFRPPMVPI